MTGGVAKVYSEALFELAEENGSIDSTEKELASLSEIFRAEPDLYKLLSAPTIPDREKTEVLSECFGGKISDTTLDFLCLLMQKGRITELEGIISAYRKLWCDKTGVLEAAVTTAVPLTKQQRSELTEKLTQKYGKKIILAEKTDPDILGGVIVSFGDTMLDGSVRTKLKNLHKGLKNVIA